jgi:hypothetical protein
MTKRLLYYLILLLLSTTANAQLEYDDFKDTQYFLKAGDNPEKIINSNIFIKAVSNKSVCYVNEPILVNYKLYTRLRSQSRVVKQPSFTGGSISELTPQEQVSTVEKVDGKLYKVYLIRSIQFIPLQEGQIKLGDVEVENKISLMKPGLNNPYDGEVIERIATLRNTDITITAKPLPTANKPTNFTNVIGQFTLQTYTDTNIIGKQEVAVFNIAIKGEGNIKNITIPTIQWPNGIEFFESKTKETITGGVFPQQGEKVFSIPFQSSKTGNISLPTVEFTYFDATTNRYETFVSKPLTINVVEGNTKPIIDNDNTAVDLSNRKYLWIVLGIALVAIGTWWWNGRKEKQPKATVIIEPTIEANIPPPVQINYRSKINDLIKREDHQFTEHLMEYFKGYLLQQLMLPHNPSISTSELIVALQTAAIDKPILAAIQSIFDDCNLAAYTPVGEQATNFKLKDRVQDVMKQLES